MSDTIRIAGLCGSLRAGSYNLMALKAAQSLAPEGVELDIVHLHDVEPYNGDVEKQGWPPGVLALRERLEPAHGILFASPEYNYSVSGVLKNAIDWMSRPTGRGPISNKPAAIMGASTGNAGTARAQAHLRDIVYYNGMPLLASVEILLFRAQEKFDSEGNLIDEKSREKLTQMMAEFADLIRLHSKT
jgi:chromate reductase